MGFIRSPKLKPEIEEQLRIKMKPRWDKGDSGEVIAYHLGFGEPKFIEWMKLDKDFKVDERFEKLRKYHVWFYRHKWEKLHQEKPEDYPLSFPPRGKPRPKGSRYNVKHKKVMSFEMFERMLNEKVAKFKFPAKNKDESYCQRVRALCILLFWTPLRCSEIIKRTRENFEIDDEVITIDLYRMKKYYAPNKPTEPFYLRTTYPLVDEVVDYLNSIVDPDERPFPITRWTAWNDVRQVFPTYYPHHFRFSYITRSVNNAKDAGQLISALLGDTGLDISTVNEYIMVNPRFRNTLNDRQMELIGLKKG